MLSPKGYGDSEIACECILWFQDPVVAKLIWISVSYTDIEVIEVLPAKKMANVQVASVKTALTAKSPHLRAPEKWEYYRNEGSKSGREQDSNFNVN